MRNLTDKESAKTQNHGETIEINNCCHRKQLFCVAILYSNKHFYSIEDRDIRTPSLRYR